MNDHSKKNNEETCQSSEPHDGFTRTCQRCRLPVDNPWLTKCPRCLYELKWINPCAGCFKHNQCNTKK